MGLDVVRGGKRHFCRGTDLVPDDEHRVQTRNKPKEVSLPVHSRPISMGASFCLAHELALLGIAVPARAGIMITPRRCIDPNLAAFRRLTNTGGGRRRNVLSPDSGTDKSKATRSNDMSLAERAMILPSYLPRDMAGSEWGNSLGFAKTIIRTQRIKALAP
jgi:hypothetical protein